jgi:hypothetical protein
MRFRRTGRTGQSSPSSRPDPSPEPISEVPKDLLEELQSRSEPKRPPRDWIQIIATALPSLAALIALIFTWQSINATTDATNRQLQVAGQGQVTDRYNAAITNLGASSVDVRLGGIYALQRIMQDSPVINPPLSQCCERLSAITLMRLPPPATSPATGATPHRGLVITASASRALSRETAADPTLHNHPSASLGGSRRRRLH